MSDEPQVISTDATAAMPQHSSHAFKSHLAGALLRPPVAPGMIGTVDHYAAIRIVGVGGMGVVVEALDTHSSQTIALKLLRPELRSDLACVHRFLVEARRMKQLSHSHIVPVLTIGENPACPYYVMPYLSRGSVLELIKPSRGLEEADVLRLAIQVAEALVFAHRRAVVHRDLKPGNIMLADDGAALVCDFGLARMLFDNSYMDPNVGHREGSAAYMAPAVAAGEAEDTRRDIYSFGATLYHMLTGAPPYTGSDQAGIIRQVMDTPPASLLVRTPAASPGLVAIVESAMARELRDRYATMQDVLDDLERVRQGQRPLGPHGRGVKRSRRSVVMMTGAALIMSAGAFWLGRKSANPGASSTNAKEKWQIPVPWSTQAEFSRDGSRALIGDAAGGARLWTLPPVK